jgi:histidinol phosphatase-like PHP family hydrolase
MIKYDLHIHVEYCGHAPGMNVAAVLKRAEELELETIAFTCHIFSEKDLAILAKIRRDIENAGTDLRVIVGAEVDVDSNHHDGRLVTNNFDAMDYVIASIHYIPGVGILPHSPADNPLTGEVFFDKWRSTVLGLVANKKINTFAHPGRLLATACDLDIFFDDAIGVFEDAAKLSAKNNIAWEINELNKKRIPQLYHARWHEIYKMALKAGVRLIYGSDAHSTDAIGTYEFTEYLLRHLPAGCLSTPQEIGL